MKWSSHCKQIAQANLLMCRWIAFNNFVCFIKLIDGRKFQPSKECVCFHLALYTTSFSIFVFFFVFLLQLRQKQIKLQVLTLQSNAISITTNKNLSTFQLAIKALRNFSHYEKRETERTATKSWHFQLQYKKSRKIHQLKSIAYFREVLKCKWWSCIVNGITTKLIDIVLSIVWHACECA